MRKKINGVLYDTANASMITETVSMTVFSGRMSIGIYRSQNGQWFQCMSPTNENGTQTISNWVSPNTAKTWLKKHSFNLQLREYFGIPECRLLPERQVLVAQKKSHNSPSSNELIQVEKLYYHPQKGWCLKQTKESVLIPLTDHEAAGFARGLQQKNGHMENPLPVLKQYLYEGEHSQHGRIAS